MAIRAPIMWLIGGGALTPLVVALGLQSGGPTLARPLTIGPTATITEASTGLAFKARVDTGAAVTSLHCPPEDVVIEDASADPVENIGKPVRLRVSNRHGQDAWIETKICDYVEVRNAEAAEHRYRVRLPLRCRGVEREALVNLNDRSRMTFRMLLGRDFLAGKFVVDVTGG